MIETRDKDVDRSEWPPGPWNFEPDRVEFEAHGFPCILQRARGHWCGYVGVPPGHPWHGMNFAGYSDEITVPYPEVHGGITYSEECRGKVCHIPKPGEPEHLFWQGFDCHHSDDVSPADMAMNWSWRNNGVYRDVEYVKAECIALARQAAEAVPA